MAIIGKQPPYLSDLGMGHQECGVGQSFPFAQTPEMHDGIR